ncbi:UNVERIFIED_CONTAM: hypothetical protein GTU68_012446 [Idotea baltica]|nr:hypothetical protein [Idotea baltica]
MGKWLKFSTTGFPIGTLSANLLACLILGFFSGLLLQKMDLSRPVQLGIMTGFCGGFSTFSTFSQESMDLFQSGKSGMALFYIGLSVLVCLGGIGLGQWMASLLKSY